MKIIYVTDLHGSTRKYDKVLEAALRHRASAVVNGGDICPKNVELLRQGEFLEGFLDAHLAEYDRAGIRYLCMSANDDLAAFDPLLDHVCARHPMAEDIAGRKVELGGCEFIGFDLVVDYPFRLKDRCRADDEAYVFGPQFGTGVLSCGRWPDVEGLRELQDWPAYARSLPSIKQELERLPEPGDAARAVYVIHMPPSGLGLDVCADGSAVGSRAVREFLIEREPMLSLHGHIHESPEVTGRWQGRLGGTVCVQPGQLASGSAGARPEAGQLASGSAGARPEAGQLSGLAYVVIDLESMDLERFEE